MKHLDPPACVFIFAGYSEPMEEFLKVNEGLARRIPYRMLIPMLCYAMLIITLVV
jgi:hypothetical protein